MMDDLIHYNYKLECGSTLDCTFVYEPSEPATFDEPGYPGTWCLVNVYCNGVDIRELLSYAVLEHIKECSEITFEMMDDTQPDQERDHDPD
jgi:hypothetical protein